jgi:hypothetical protein
MKSEIEEERRGRGRYRNVQECRAISLHRDPLPTLDS